MWLGYFYQYPDVAATVEDVLAFWFPNPIPASHATEFEVAMGNLEAAGVRASHYARASLATYDLIEGGLLERKWVDGKYWWMLADGVMPQQVATIIEDSPWTPPSLHALSPST